MMIAVLRGTVMSKSAPSPPGFVATVVEHG